MTALALFAAFVAVCAAFYAGRRYEAQRGAARIDAHFREPYDSGPPSEAPPPIPACCLVPVEPSPPGTIDADWPCPGCRVLYSAKASHFRECRCRS